MVKNKYIYGLFLILMSGLCSCSEERLEVVPGETSNTDLQEQAVELYLGGNSIESDIIGRALPPGMEQNGISETTCNVNEVALMVFRRKAGSNDDFTFDVDNSAGFDETGKLNGKGNICKDFTTETSPLGSTLKKTTGKITKDKAYEYRMFALGYNTARKDEHPSKISEFDEREDFLIVDSKGNGINENTTLSEVKLQLVKRYYKDLSEFLAHRDYLGSYSVLSQYKINHHITGYWVRTPEIFYGNCHTTNKQDETISFEDDNEVTGTLFRGVARVNVTIKELENILNDKFLRHVCEFSLLIDSLRTEVHLNSYDNFKTPESLLLQPWTEDEDYQYGSEANANNYMTFTAVAGEDACMEKSSSITLSFFVLPTITQMRVRYATSGSAHLTKYVYESYIAVPSESNGNQATGVIDPAAGGKIFYFRRNQQYVIMGDGQQIKDNNEGN